MLAVSRSGQRFTERLRDIVLRAGDVIVLQGPLVRMPAQLRELGCLPLAAREIRLGNVRHGLIPLGILIAAMTLAGTGVLPVGIAFFGAGVLVVLSGALSLREAYETVDWPILIMLGTLIPVSEAIRTTGGADLLAGGLSSLAHTLPAYGALALILVAAMALTGDGTGGLQVWRLRASRRTSVTARGAARRTIDHDGVAAVITLRFGLALQDMNYSPHDIPDAGSSE